MAAPSTPPPRNDINRFGQAWALLQAFVNITLPLATGRLASLRGRLHR